MTMVIQEERIPLNLEKDGTIRVSNTRVTLDIVIEAFRDGATAEEIVSQYPVLDLSDVYYVIGYYLRRRDQVEKYLASRREESDKIRQMNQRRFPTTGMRERLLARKSGKSDRIG